MIRYNGLPITPEGDMVLALQGKHCMVSMADDRQIDTALEIAQSCVGDSGAFTVWQNGGVLDVDGYKLWARFWLRHPAFEWVVIPDVIAGTERENDELLADWPFPAHQSVPVFHLHESIERLRRLKAGGYPLIALGSSGEFNRPGSEPWWLRMAIIMDVLCDQDGFPEQAFHGLRMLDSTLFSHVPFRSVDSCNVGRNIGMDVAWNGPYAPNRRWIRALIMIARNEGHAAARRWCRQSSGIQQNMELLG